MTDYSLKDEKFLSHGLFSKIELLTTYDTYEPLMLF